MKPTSSLLFFPVTALAIGIVCAFSGAGLVWAAVSVACALILYLYLLSTSKNPIRAYKTGYLHYVWVSLMFFGLGILCFDLTEPYSPGQGAGLIRAAEGRIESIRTTASGDRAIIDVKRIWDRNGNIRETSRFRIQLNSDHIPAEVDDNIIVQLKLIPIVNKATSFFISSYQRKLSIDGLEYKSICRPEDIRITGRQTTLSGAGRRIRERLEEGIEKSGLNSKTSHFLITVLLGEKSFLSDDTTALFSDAGVSHVLALSGMHVGIMAGIMLWLLLPLNLTGHHKLRWVFSLCLLGFYAFITGWAFSTVRAVLMACAITMGILLERKNTAWNALLFAALIILVVTPRALFDVGFQLSFVCVASLIFFASHYNPVDHRSRPILYKTTELIIASLVASISTWILSAYYFGSVPIMFLPANLVLLPLLPCFLVVAIIYLCLNACGVHLEFLVEVLNKSFEWCGEFLSVLTDGGNTAINFTPSGWSVCLWLLMLLFLAFMLNSSKKGLWGTFAASTAVACAISLFVYGNDTPRYGVIVPADSSRILIKTFNDGVENEIALSRQCMSDFTIGDKRFLVQGGRGVSSATDTTQKCHVLIVAGGDGEDFKRAAALYRPEMIVIHTLLRKAREKEILWLADSLGITSHSVRNSGTWKMLLE